MVDAVDNFIDFQDNSSDLMWFLILIGIFFTNVIRMSIKSNMGCIVHASKEHAADNDFEIALIV